MTPTDLETLFDNWLKLRAERLAIPQVINLLGSAKKAKAEFVVANSEALTALLAERDALRERERQLKQLVHQWNEHAKDTGFVRIPNYAPQVYENCADELQSILNATPAGEDLRVSEGERG